MWETTKLLVAKAALDQIAELYVIEDKARFAPPAERLAHRAAAIPLLDAFFAWAQAAEKKLSARSALAEALRRDTIKRRTALTRYATDARLEPDNNIAENAMRGIASADATGSSPAAMPAASVPPRCTPTRRPRN